MKLLDRLAARWGYTRKPAPAGRRSFQAAMTDRLTAGFSGSLTSINADLEAQLPVLRGRARNLAANSELMIRYKRLAARNIVGPSGFVLQARVMDPPAAPNQPPRLDQQASQAIETAWYKWTRRQTCDISGRYSFWQICRILAMGLPIDGEGIVRGIKDRALPFGFALQLLDIDRLDHSATGTINGAAVRMGVQLDATGRPTGYHILERSPYDSATQISRNRTQIVPADALYHVFIPDRAEQIRGYPWIHAAIGGVNMLAGFEEAAVVAARVGASKMGFFTLPEGGGEESLADSEDAETKDLLTEVNPGQFGTLPPGYQFQAFNPDYPNQNFGPFVKSRAQRIASACDVAHHNLTGDMESVNYSSARIAELGERDGWMMAQEAMLEAFVYPVARAWLEMALLKGAIVLPNGTPLPATKLDKLWSGMTFQARRWGWVDPTKEIDAAITAIKAGLRSRTGISNETGTDLEEVFTDLQREKEAAAQLGIDIEGSPGAKSTPAEGAPPV